MNRILHPFVAATFVLSSWTVWAAEQGHEGHHGAGANAASPTATDPAAEAVTEGEIRKIDKDNGKITLKHGEIRNLGMPPMTMVFRLKDPSRLDAVQQGDKVRFTAVKENGSFVVTKLEAVR